MADRVTYSQRGVFYNALSLTSGGGGVQTYCRELIRSVAELTGRHLSARIQRQALGELPDHVEP